MLRRGAQPSGGGVLLVGRLGQRRRPADDPADRTVERASHDCSSRGRVGGEVTQPGHDRLGVSVRQHAVVTHRGLTDHEQWGASQAALGQHRREMAAHLVLRPRRHPVEHDRNRGAALDGGTQQVPGHGVGVACGRRDESQRSAAASS